MDRDAVAATALADLHLVLARAFLPPQDPAFALAFLHDLPEELAEIVRELPFDGTGPVQGLRRSVGGLEAGALLQLYSALFLQPPQRASLDASVYLDGAALGPTAEAVSERYAAYGLRPADRPGEFADHLSRLLEFAGFLFGRAAGAPDAAEAAACAQDAREFVGRFVRPWVPALAVEIRAACEAQSLALPYLHLAELVALVAWEGEGWRRVDTGERARRAPAQAHCCKCGRPYAEDAALRAVRRIMEKKGLATSHLDRCENCRGLTDEQSGELELRAV